jgi:hypothetical protein
MKHLSSIALALALLLVSAQAHAHISYGDLGTLSNIGDSGSVTKTNVFSRYGWALGADNDLGDSHKVGNAGGFFKFALTQAATVQISINAASVTMDPALSVYAGLLPSGSHDNDSHDLTGLYEFFDNGAFLYKASARDMAPNDPQISRYIPVGFTPEGPILDANYPPGTPVPSLVENPIWNTPDANLGGLSPAQWYEANYTPHNGYRDTLNFTTQGGLQLDATYGWVPDNFDPVNGPFGGFSGQFDPFGDWSMANGSGEWSKVFYISSASDSACEGPNCLSTTTGGFLNPGHVAGNNGTMETLLLHLAAGNYMIAADGEACTDTSGACRNPFQTATVSVAVVPIPGAVWLFGSILAGLIGVMKRRQSGAA